MEKLETRLSKALMEIAVEEEKVESYLSESEDVYKILDENESFLRALSSAFISKEEKDKLLNDVFKNKIETNFLNYLKLVTNSSQAHLLKVSLREFRKLAELYLSVYSGVVYSTSKLDKEDMSKLVKSLEKKLQHKVKLSNVIDESLIGGIKVEINGKVYDFSVKEKLERLGSDLKKGGL